MTSKFDEQLRDELIAHSRRLSEMHAPALQAGSRGGRRLRWAGGAGAMVAAAAAVAAVATGSSDQAGAARQQAAADGRAALKNYPEVAVGELSASQQQALRLSGNVEGVGHRLGSDPATATVVFETEGGQYCATSPNESACFNPDQLSPTISFGWNRERSATYLKLLAPAGVSGLQAHTTDGNEVPLRLDAGQFAGEVTGRVNRLTWVSGGVPLSQDVEIELAAGP